MSLTNTRNHTVDAVKLIAAFFVVCIHTRTISELDNFEQGSISFIIDNIARFAVPFFFMAGGYHINFNNGRKLAKRLLTVTLVCALWSVVFYFIREQHHLSYPTFFFSAYEDTNVLWNKLYKIFFYGYERHLWFFPAYIIAAVLILLLRKQTALVLLLAILLYGIGLTGQQFKFIYPEQVEFLPMSFHQWLQQTNITRSGLFFAFPCMSVGFIMRQISSRIEPVSPVLFFVIVLLLLLLQYYECLSVMNAFEAGTSDYYISTLFLAGAILGLAISFKMNRPLFSGISRIPGGIYILHPLFMYFFLINFPELFNNELWIYLYTIVLFVLSFLLAWIISSIPYLRKVIMA